MNIQHFHGVPPLYTNTFLIITNAKHGIIIDAAAEPETYLKALDEAGATLTHILQTHGHFDHVGAVASLKKATGCKVYMDKIDAEGSQLLPLTPDVITDEWPANGELVIDELRFEIYRTPGHTKGGVCLSCYGLLFSGDTLFAGSCGRTDFEGGLLAAAHAASALILKRGQSHLCEPCRRILALLEACGGKRLRVARRTEFRLSHDVLSPPFCAVRAR